MPGCVSQGRDRDETLHNVVLAIQGWVETEAEQGRQPLPETPDVVSAAVAEALEIIREMRDEGEAPDAGGYELELAAIEVEHPVRV